jgi:hypothetical protein
MTLPDANSVGQQGCDGADVGFRHQGQAEPLSGNASLDQPERADQDGKRKTCLDLGQTHLTGEEQVEPARASQIAVNRTKTRLRMDAPLIDEQSANAHRSALLLSR